MDTINVVFEQWHIIRHGDIHANQAGADQCRRCDGKQWGDSSAATVNFPVYSLVTAGSAFNRRDLGTIDNCGMA